MELVINLMALAGYMVVFGFLFSLGMFGFNYLQRKLSKKSYTEKRGS